MKKILGLTIAIVLIVGVVAGGTWAYFSDTETVTGNTFTAGTIDISLDPTSGQAVTVEGALDLKPSQTGYIPVLITNDGSNPADIWKRIDNVVNIENEITEPEQAYYTLHPGSVNKLLSNWIHYDMVICSYSEVCYDETDFTFIDVAAEAYEFDVCRVTEGGNVIWTLDYVEATVPSLSHSAVQLVISLDGGTTPAFQIGINSAQQPMYGTYTAGWDPVTNVLPAGMSVVGNIGDTHFEIEIPNSYLGCPDFHWAMNVEADFAATSGSSQYRWPSGGWTLSPSDYFSATCNCEEIIAEAAGFTLTGANFIGSVESFYIYLGVLEPGEALFVTQSYHLDATVDNWGQSDQVSFDMEFFAQQTVGDPLPDPPTPELTGYEKGP